jgi:hypothetical protein
MPHSLSSSHLQNQQDNNEQLCYLWAPTLEHEEDNEFGLSFSSTIAKNNMMMANSATIHRHLFAHILEKNNDKQLCYLSSCLGGACSKI